VRWRWRRWPPALADWMRLDGDGIVTEALTGAQVDYDGAPGRSSCPRAARSTGWGGAFGQRRAGATGAWRPGITAAAGRRATLDLLRGRGRRCGRRALHRRVGQCQRGAFRDGGGVITLARSGRALDAEAGDRRPARGAVRAAGGTCTWRRDAAGLVQEEIGTLHYGDAPPIRAERRYLWRAEGDRLAVFFEDGRAFHRLGPGRTATGTTARPILMMLPIFSDALALSQRHGTSPARARITLSTAYTQGRTAAQDAAPMRSAFLRTSTVRRSCIARSSRSVTSSSPHPWRGTGPSGR
jgi:hypothetical protein